MSDTSPSAPNIGKQSVDAIATYRSIAKWVVSTFGAVAAAFLVGLSLTSLGGLSWWRTLLSILCAAVGLYAVARVVSAATSVLEPLRVTFFGFRNSPDFEPLRKLLTEDPTPLNKEATTAHGLFEKYERYKNLEKQARDHAKKHPDDERAAGLVLTRERNVDILNERLTNLAVLGQMLRVKEVYEEAKSLIYKAVALAAAAAIGFAIVSDPPHHDAAATTTTTGTTTATSTTAGTVKPTHIHVSVGGPRLLDWPRSCGRLYFALGKLAAEQPRVGPLWPKGSLSPWDRKCGLETRGDVQRALEFLGHH